MRIGLVGHGIGKSEILLAGPNAHLAFLLGADLSSDLHRILLKTAEAYEVVHDGRELVAKSVEVGGCIGRASSCTTLKKVILLINDSLRIDLAYDHTLEVGL